MSITIGGGFAIIERREWGARPARGRTSYGRSVHGGKTVHYSTGEELGVDDTAQWVRNIQTYHMDDRGWDDVGYHFLFDRFGNIFEGRPLLTVGAHAGHSAGNRTAGECFLGDDDPGQDVPDIARSALAHLGAHIDQQAGEGPWFGHRDWKNTPCPGGELYRLLPHINNYLIEEDPMPRFPDAWKWCRNAGIYSKHTVPGDNVDTDTLSAFLHRHRRWVNRRIAAAIAGGASTGAVIAEIVDRLS